MNAARISFCILLWLGATAHDQKVNPVEKVVELLKKVAVQVEEEGRAEAAQYDKFACFCKEQARGKTWAIEKSEKKIKKLEAQIEELEADIAELTEKVADLAKKIEELEKKIEKLIAERTKAQKAYLVEAEDMDAAISAMKRAIAALQKSKDEMTDAKLDFVQLRAVLQTGMHMTNLSEEQVKALAVLLDGKQSPASSSYHSNDIIETLKEMEMEFKKNKAELDEAELQDKHMYNKKKLGAENEKQFAEHDKAETEELIGKKEDELASAKEDLATETKDKEADETFLKELTGTCEEKAKLWDQRSTSRGKELSAIAEATEVLEAGVQSNYGANAKLAGLQREGRILSFLQRGSQSSEQGLSLGRTLKFLEEVARRLNSPALSVLALKVHTQKDHFVKVRSMIKDFIAKLEKEAEEEAEQKSFCDKQMGKAIESRDEQNAKIEELTAEMSKMTMLIKKLKAEIAELSMQIGELYKALKEAEELRFAEKTSNEKTLSDAAAGVDATKYAIKVLKGFYDSKLLQLSRYTPKNAGRDGKTVGDLAPDTFEDEEYKGNQDAAKGIIGLIEVIISDFERTIDTTEKAEKEAQEKFDKFKEDTQEDIKEKENEKKEKKGKVAELSDKLAEAKEKLEEAQKELGLVMEELQTLEPQCVEQPENWKEKNKKRQEEIEALKQAMVILDEWQNE